jgi:hypothetical protein
MGFVQSLLATWERGREGERERVKEGERKGGRKGEVERGREGERERGKEGKRERGREEEREKRREVFPPVWLQVCNARLLTEFPSSYKLYMLR